MSRLAEIFLNDNRPIHERYHMLANSLNLVPPILKTDLWNELKTAWTINADLYVEIDTAMVVQAKQVGLNAIGGNIEKLPVDDQSISSLVDFSTLDHIPDPYPALKEYFRVLKNESKSRCLLVCWVGNKAPQPMKNWHGLQYYFNEQLLIKKIIRAGFRIRWQEKFEGLGDQDSALKCFYLEKPGYFNKIKHSFLNLISPLKKNEVPDPLFKFKHFAVFQPADIAHYPTVNIEHQTQIDISKFCFTVISEDPQIILSGINLPNENFLIEIEIESPKENLLQVFYLPRGKTVFTQDFSVTKRIFPGQNRSRVFIPEAGTGNPLRLDPCNSMGTYCISRIGIARIRV